MKLISKSYYSLFIIKDAKIEEIKRLRASSLSTAILETNMIKRNDDTLKDKILEIFETVREMEYIDFNKKNKKTKEPLWRLASRIAATLESDTWDLKGGEWNEIGTLLRG